MHEGEDRGAAAAGVLTRIGADRAAPSVAVAVRRVVVGYRVVGLVWLAVLAAVALATAPARPLLVAATVALAGLATGLTVLLAFRHPGVLSTWPWLAVDVAVAAATILAPSVAGVGGRPFYGGYPFSAVLLAAVVRSLPAGLAAAAALAAVSVLRLRWEGAAAALPDVVGSVLLYGVGAAVTAWAVGVIRRDDATRRALEASLLTERAERRRSQDRAETAAHLHDSVLQTLALVQRRAHDPDAVVALVRGQERELRAWLAGPAPAPASDASFAAAVERAAADVEGVHPVQVEVVTVGDAPLDDDLVALVAATREALLNAARHAGVATVSLYAELTADGVRVYVRDRGHGFDPADVPADRRGLRESIVGRLNRHGGAAVVRSALGEGAEIELILDRRMR